MRKGFVVCFFMISPLALLTLQPLGGEGKEIRFRRSLDFTVVICSSWPPGVMGAQWPFVWVQGDLRAPRQSLMGIFGLCSIKGRCFLCWLPATLHKVLDSFTPSLSGLHHAFSPSSHARPLWSDPTPHPSTGFRSGPQELQAPFLSYTLGNVGHSQSSTVAPQP